MSVRNRAKLTCNARAIRYFNTQNPNDLSPQTCGGTSGRQQGPRFPSTDINRFATNDIQHNQRHRNKTYISTRLTDRTRGLHGTFRTNLRTTICKSPAPHSGHTDVDPCQQTLCFSNTYPRSQHNGSHNQTWPPMPGARNTWKLAARTHARAYLRPRV